MPVLAIAIGHGLPASARAGEARAGGLPLATRGARVERVGLYSCSCDAVIDDFGCGSGSQGLRPWWLHRDDRVEWRWPS